MVVKQKVNWNNVREILNEVLTYQVCGFDSSQSYLFDLKESEDIINRDDVMGVIEEYLHDVSKQLPIDLDSLKNIPSRYVTSKKDPESVQNILIYFKISAVMYLDVESNMLQFRYFYRNIIPTLNDYKMRKVKEILMNENILSDTIKLQQVFSDAPPSIGGNKEITNGLSNWLHHNLSFDSEQYKKDIEKAKTLIKEEIYFSEYIYELDNF